MGLAALRVRIWIFSPIILFVDPSDSKKQFLLHGTQPAAAAKHQDDFLNKQEGVLTKCCDEKRSYSTQKYFTGVARFLTSD